MSVLVLYAQLRLQGHLPFNPDHQKGVEADAVVQHRGQLPHQHELAELRRASRRCRTSPRWPASRCTTSCRRPPARRSRSRSSAASSRRRTHTLGNFWVDLVRTTTRVLLPLAFVFALVLVSQGVVQNFHAAKTVTTVAGQTQTIPGGPVASQEAIKEIGENGGGPYNANSAHPFENPNPITNMLADLDAARDPVRVPVDVREDGRRP